MPRPGLTGTSLANRERTSLASSTAARRSSIRDPKPLRTGGRNSEGRKTARHKGGGHKRQYRLVDFKRNKDGVDAKVAAVEYARDGIRVNCVCPGTFLSQIHADLPEEAIDAIAAKHPLGLGTAADLVGAYSYLASEASRWTTGAAIVVDGGYAAP